MGRGKKNGKGKRPRRTGRIVAILIVAFIAFVLGTAYVSGQRLRRAAETDPSQVDRALQQVDQALDQTRQRLDRTAREQGFDSWPEMMRESSRQADSIRKTLESPTEPESGPAGESETDDATEPGSEPEPPPGSEEPAR